MESMLALGLGLLGAAALLLLIEVFVPSGGLIAIVALGVAIGGIVALFRHSTTWGLTGVLLVIVMGPTTFLYALRLLPATKTGRAMLGEVPEEQRLARELADRADRERRSALIGAEGVALTDLFPAGVVEIDGQKYDAVAEGGLIDSGQRIRVTKATAFELTVRTLA